jgi:hypothetical protein
MKPPFILTSLLLATAVSVPAGQISKEVVPVKSGEITHEVEASYSASAGASSNVSPRRNANVSEQNTHFQYVLSYAVPDRPIIRFGVGYDRYDFGFAGPGFIPGALQSLNLIAGIDLKISDVLIRIEAQPGFYSDNHGFNGGDFNVPVVIGGSYLVSADFQWVAGVYVNPNSSYPVWGGAGFRWKMSDRWVLNAVPPNPRLEFKATDDLTLYAGGQIIVSTFRVNQNFGTGGGFGGGGFGGGGAFRRNYGNALVDYTEIRTGVGASWKMCPKSTLELEVGYMPYRDFDYHKVGDNYQTKSGAIYGEVGLKLSF